ncbi:hypothetical protein ACLOJK_027956 [Asimina triloba]
MQRVTRSQTSAASSNIPNSKMKEESEKVRSGKPKSERSVLFDITNDSPIVGLAMGSLKTPSSVAKGRAKRTPGSGEALLRGQVKTLLQKVEEDSELPKFSLDDRPFPTFNGLPNSPAGILAPTPANTPLMSNLADEDSKIAEVVHSIESSQQESSTITQALQFDSPRKWEGSGSSTISSLSSVLTRDEDDNASLWSVQANASWKEGGDNEGEEEEGGLIDELCEGLRLISVGEKKGLPEFAGRHTHFIYDSDGEMEGEEVVVGLSSSPSILRLNGMPLPEGKHLRFPDEDLED